LLNAPCCFGSGLVEAVVYNELCDNALISLSMRWEGTILAEGDLVRLDGCPYLICGCIEANGEFALLTHALRKVNNVTPAASRWDVVNQVRLELLAGRSLRLCGCWTEESNERVLIVDRA